MQQGGWVWWWRHYIFSKTRRAGIKRTCKVLSAPAPTRTSDSSNKVFSIEKKVGNSTIARHTAGRHTYMRRWSRAEHAEPVVDDLHHSGTGQAWGKHEGCQ